MNNRFITALIVLVVIGDLHGGGDIRQEEKIRATITQIVAKEKIPGMIAAIADGNGVIAIAATGVRKMGGNGEKLTEKDLFHIGSCTKAMTSTMLATLIADGKLSWETKLIEVFPELKQEIHVDHHQTTLWMLVTHRSGVAANAKDWSAHSELEIKARRLAILKENLNGARKARPGKYLYSNLGYMVAACMAEKVTGKSWELLVKQRLFQPLGVRSAGFGPPGKREDTSQPWGHSKSTFGSWKPKYGDNPPALGPAGRVHCTVEDWAKFAALQLPTTKLPILDRQQLDKLIEPTGNYAAGWGVSTHELIEGSLLKHVGSNTIWDAAIWIAPKLDRTFIVITNSHNRASSAICKRVMESLVEIDRESRKR